MTNQQPEEWEDEMRILAACCSGYNYCSIDHEENMKHFIQGLLTHQREQMERDLREKINALEPHDTQQGGLLHLGYLEAKTDVLSLLANVEATDESSSNTLEANDK